MNKNVQQQHVYWGFKFRSRQGQNNKQNVLVFKPLLCTPKIKINKKQFTPLTSYHQNREQKEFTNKNGISVGHVLILLS